VGPAAVTLGRKASEITVADIVSVDETMIHHQCGGKENYQDDGTRCMTRPLVFFEYQWSSFLTRSVCKSWSMINWPKA
jgi:Rrf2 family iron-sulfur cluster assembly transcriptional regulator